MSRYILSLTLLLLTTACLTHPASGEIHPPPASNEQPISDVGRSSSVKLGKKVKETGHVKEISLFALSKDGRVAVTADGDENNYLWNTQSGTLVREIGKPEAVRIRVVIAAFSPDSSQLLWARNGKNMPVLWDIESGRRLGVLSSKEKGHTENVVSMNFSADGRYIATGDAAGTVVIWNRVDRSVVRRIRAHSGGVNHLTFIPGKNELATAGSDGAVRLWGISGTELLATLLAPSEHAITALTGSADGQVLYAALDDMTVKGWMVSLRSLRTTLSFNNRQINCIALSPDGDFMALAEEDDSIKLWSIRESRVAWKSELNSSVTQVFFSPDGKKLFTAGGDNWIREWDAASGHLQKKFAGAGE